MMSSRQEMAAEFIKMNGVSARDVMTAEVVTVKEDASAGEIAALLEENRIKRVPVVRDGKVVGIVSRSNLLQGLAALAGRVLIKARGNDQAVRDAIENRLKDQPWSRPISVNVVVTHSIAHLWGVVDSEEERAAIRVLTEGTPGVAGVEDHLSVLKTVAYAV
jgi:CBS-domain-containing membrane protein